MKIYIPILAIFCSYFPQSYWITGQVVRVLDGDTIILNTRQKRERIRFVYIDAPEVGQGHIALFSKKYLESKIENKNVQINIVGKGHYGRKLGEIFFNGQSINLELVKRGAVMLYPWSKFLSLKSKNKYVGAQRYAKNKLLGIWKSKITKPWNYRRSNK